MSKLTDQIREYISSPQVDGNEHYGKWGALRKDQRLLIKKLCDQCDTYKEATDNFASELKKECEEHEQFVKETIEKLAEKDKIIKKLTDSLLLEDAYEAQKKNGFPAKKIDIVESVIRHIRHQVCEEIRNEAYFDHYTDCDGKIQIVYCIEPEKLKEIEQGERK